MDNKELQKQAENYIESNNITKNTYAIEKAFRDGAKMILNKGQLLPIDIVSKRSICGCGEPKVEHSCQNCKGEIKYS